MDPTSQCFTPKLLQFPVHVCAWWLLPQQVDMGRSTSSGRFLNLPHFGTIWHFLRSTFCNPPSRVWKPELANQEKGPQLEPSPMEQKTVAFPGACLHSVNYVYLHPTVLPPSSSRPWKHLFFHLSHFEVDFLSLTTSPIPSTGVLNLDMLPELVIATTSLP